MRFFLIFLWLSKPKARLAKHVIFYIIVATGETNCQGEMRVEKEEERKMSEFAQSTSRSPKQYLREEAIKVKKSLKDNKKFQE